MVQMVGLWQIMVSSAVKCTKQLLQEAHVIRRIKGSRQVYHRLLADLVEQALGVVIQDRQIIIPNRLAVHLLQVTLMKVVVKDLKQIWGRSPLEGRCLKLVLS